MVITPAALRVVAGDTLRLHAQPLDAQGQPVSGARILFQGGGFEGAVDSTGLVMAGAVGTLQVAVSGDRPRREAGRERVQVHMVAGPAARVDVATHVEKVLAGQQVRLEAAVYSRAPVTGATIVSSGRRRPRRWRK